MTENNPTADAPKAPAIAPISIHLNPEDGHYLVAQDGRSSTPLCWDEMIEQIIALTRTGPLPKYPMLTAPEIIAKEFTRQERAAAIALEREAEERQRRETVTITLSREEAAEIQDGISDVLCWLRGWLAANAGGDNEPIGIDRLRNLNRRLKNAISEAAR